MFEEYENVIKELRDIADELLAQNKRLQQQGDELVAMLEGNEARIAVLNAANEQLRAALDHLATECEARPDVMVQVHQEVSEARAVLEEK